ncbi:MAG TPA: Tn3 family transposase, partial [Solirubrobacteraceae bacterium]
MRENRRLSRAAASPKYFGRRRGATWLNLLSAQSVGLASKVVSGTPRDSPHIVDLIYRQDGGWRPEVIVSDTGSYSDIAFGLLQRHRVRAAAAPRVRL